MPGRLLLLGSSLGLATPSEPEPSSSSCTPLLRSQSRSRSRAPTVVVMNRPVRPLNTDALPAALALAGTRLSTARTMLMDVPPTSGSRQAGGTSTIIASASTVPSSVGSSRGPPPWSARILGRSAGCGPAPPLAAIPRGAPLPLRAPWPPTWSHSRLPGARAATVQAPDRASSPPPFCFFRQGCSPASIRRRASLPAAVGALHGLLRRWQRRAAHPPHREQNTMGRSPWALQITWPLSAKAAACSRTRGPGHRWSPDRLIAFSSLVHPAQIAHRQAPALNCQKWTAAPAAASFDTGLGFRGRLPGAGGKSGRTAAAAFATSGARLV
jgi:hypothetical protein